MKSTPASFLLLCTAALGLLSSGCATITRGTTEQLMVQSEPSGASVRLSNGFTGITPATFTVPRKGDLIVTVSKDGYDPSDVMVPSKLAGAGTAGFVGNALVGGIIGGGVDIATGATLSHVPNPVKVTLIKKAGDGLPVPPATQKSEAVNPPAAASPVTADQNRNPAGAPQSPKA